MNTELRDIEEKIDEIEEMLHAARHNPSCDLSNTMKVSLDLELTKLRMKAATIRNKGNGR